MAAFELNRNSERRDNEERIGNREHVGTGEHAGTGEKRNNEFNGDVFNANRNEQNQFQNANLNPTRLREECIVAFKVYDSCRQLK